MGELLFGRDLFDRLAAEARAVPRRRTNANFHPSADFPAHRFVIAMEPDSYVQPHRHNGAQKEETLVVLRGRFGLLLFEERGSLARKALLEAGGAFVGANVPPRTYHSLVALEPGSIFLEAKAGPYDPATDKDLAPWAPGEGSPEAAAYLARLKREFA